MSKMGELAMQQQEHEQEMEYSYHEGYEEGLIAGVRQGADQVTKKDYEMIAGILRDNYTPKAESVKQYKQWLNIVMAFENALAADNPKFSRSKFLEACNAIGGNQAAIRLHCCV